MKKIALPISGARISPLFDVAQTLLLVLVQDGECVSREQYALGDPRGMERVRILAALGVEVLLCSGISRCVERAVQTQGVEVISLLVGAVDDILAAYCASDSSIEGMRMPGRCMARQRRRRGCRQLS